MWVFFMMVCVINRNCFNLVIFLGDGGSGVYRRFFFGVWGLVLFVDVDVFCCE